jgi:hypothetical protein
VKKQEDEIHNNGLFNHNLQVIFKKLGLHINYNGKPITKGVGLHVAILSKGSWHGSNQADWQIDKCDNNKMILKAKWRRLAVEQVWQISLNEKNELIINIITENKSEISLDNMVIYILCVSDYARYFSFQEEGEFLEITSEDTWEAMLLSDVKNGCIGIKPDETNKDLPSILFENTSDKCYIANIFNADIKMNGRALQYVLGPLAKESTCNFSGVISFNKLRLKEYFASLKAEKENLLEK